MSRERKETHFDPEPPATVELLDQLPMFTILGGLAGRCEINPEHNPAWSVECRPGVEPDETSEAILAPLGLRLGDAADVDGDFDREIGDAGYTTTHSALAMLNAGRVLIKVPDASGERTRDGSHAHYWYVVER